MKSVVSYPERGSGGNNKYRGNCSPKLIEDIIQQYHVEALSDYMVGSGTTEDVCQTLGIQGTFLDLNRGFDMISMDMPERNCNIFWHPPYDDIIVYSDIMYSAADIKSKYGFDPRENDLSRCANWDDFVEKMNYCMLKQFSSLDKNGRMFVLVGDIKKKGKLYSMQRELTLPGTLEQIIIKMQHNCVSDNRTYAGRFVPIVHEYLIVLKKESSMIFNINCSKSLLFDIRDSANITWRDLLISIMEDKGVLSLNEVYQLLDGHRKCTQNQHWKEKVRQVLRSYPNIFKNTSRGCYAIA